METEAHASAPPTNEAPPSGHDQAHEGALEAAGSEDAFPAQTETSATGDASSAPGQPDKSSSESAQEPTEVQLAVKHEAPEAPEDQRDVEPDAQPVADGSSHGPEMPSAPPEVSTPANDAEPAAAGDNVEQASLERQPETASDAKDVNILSLETASAPTVQDYLGALGVECGERADCRGVLTKLIGEKNMKRLDVTEEWAEHLLILLPIVERSTAVFSAERPALTLSDAHLELDVSSISDEEVESTRQPLCQAHVDISWTLDGTLSLTFSASPSEGGESLLLVKEINRAFRTIALRTVLGLLGLENETALDARPVLAALGRSNDTITDISKLLPPSIDSLNFLSLPVNPGETSLDCSHDLQGGLVVHSASLRNSWPKIDESIGAAKFSIGGIRFAIREYWARYDTRETHPLSLEVAGSVECHQNSALSFILETLFNEQGQPVARVRLPDVHSFSDLDRFIAASPSGDIEGHFQHNHTAGVSGLETTAFYLEPPATPSDEIRISRLVASSRSANLAHGTPLFKLVQRVKITGALSLRVEVLEPLNAAKRSATIIIGFPLSVSKASTPVVLTGTAHLAPGQSQYTYTFEVDDPSKALSIRSLADQLELLSLNDLLDGDPLLLRDIVDSVHVTSFKALMVEAAGTFEMQSWIADFAVDAMHLIPDLIALEAVTIHVQNEESRTTWSARGILRVGPPSRVVRIPISIPQLGKSSTFDLETSPELTLDGVAAALGISLDDLSSLPIIGDLLKLPLHAARLRLDEIGKRKVLSAATVELRQEFFKVGSLVLNDHRPVVSFAWDDTNSASGSPTFTYRSTASLTKAKVAAALQYASGSAEDVSLSLRPSDSAATIGSVLEEIIPIKVPEQILSLLRKLPFLGADIGLDRGNSSIKTAILHTDDISSIKLGSAAITALEILYDRHSGEHEGRPSTSQNNAGAIKIRGLLGGAKAPKANATISMPSSQGSEHQLLALSIKPSGGGHLPLVELLSGLGIGFKKFQPPSKNVEFSLESLDGRVNIVPPGPKGQAPSFSVETLDILAESPAPITLVEKLDLKFDRFRLNAHYTKGAELMVNIEARLVLGEATLWMALSASNGHQRYHGEVETSNLNLDGVVRALGCPIAMAAPKFLQFQNPLPISKIIVDYTSGKALELAAIGSATTSVLCSGVSFQLGAIGGHFKVSPTRSKNGPDFEAHITGNLMIPGFLAAEARLLLSEQNVIMTAVLQAAPGAAGKGLELIADFLGESGNLSWDSIVPSSSAPLSFDKSGVALRVDFAASKVVALGIVDRVGQGVLITKALPDQQHGCYISLSVQDLTALWPKSFHSLSAFQLANLSVEVLTFSTTAKELQAELQALAKDVAVQARPATIQLPDTKLAPGAWVFGTVILTGSSEMARALSMGMDPACKPTVYLYGHIARDERDSVYSVDLRNFALLGGKVVVNGTGVYTPANKVLAIDATLTLTGLTDQPLSLDVLMSVSPGQVSLATKDPPSHPEPEPGTLQGTQPRQASREQSVGRLFQGKMFNVELTAPKFHGSSSNHGGKLVHTQVLTAGVKLGEGAVDPTVLGSVFFQGGKPQVASLSFTRAVSVAEIFASVIAPKAKKSGSWPTQFPALQFSDTRLYYSPAKEKLSLEGLEYFPGYHMKAQMSYFDKIFDISLDLPDDRSGVKLSGACRGDIDLGFAQIKTPSMLLNTTGSKPSFTVEAQVAIFGVDNIHLSLDYDLGGGGDTPSNAFSGVAKYKGTLFGIEKPQVQFKFGNNTFSIPAFGASHPGDGLFDLADSIVKASSTDKSCSCGDLAGLKLDGVKTKFAFNFSLSQDKSPTASRLSLTATARVSLDATVHGKTAASVPLGEVVLTITAPFTKDSLTSALVAAIKTAAVHAGQEMLNHPDELAKVIALLSVSKYSKQVTSRLLCRKVRPKNLVDHAASLAEADASIIEKSASVAIGLIKAVPLPVPGVPLPKTLIAFAAAGAAVEAASIGFAAVGAASSLTGMLLALPLSLLGLAKRRDKAKESVREAEEALARAKAAIEDSLVLRGEPVARFEADDGVVIDWSNCVPKDKKVDFDSLHWSVRFGTVNKEDDPATREVEVPPGVFHCKVSNEQFQHERQVYAWVRAGIHAEKHHFAASKWTASKPAFHVPILRAPPAVALTVPERPPWAPEITQESASSKCEVQIVGSAHDLSEVVLWSQSPARTPDRLTVESTRLTCPAAAKPIVSLFARTRYTSEDEKKARHSQWVRSPVVQTSPGPSDITITTIRETVTIKYSYSGSQHINIELFTLAGAKVEILERKAIPPGNTQQQQQQHTEDLRLSPSHIGEELVLHAQSQHVPGQVSLLIKTTFKLSPPLPTQAAPAVSLPSPTTTIPPVSPPVSPLVEAGEILAIEPVRVAPPVTLVDPSAHDDAKKPLVSVTVRPVSDGGHHVPILSNGTFASGSTAPWRVDHGANPVHVVQPGLVRGSRYKVLMAVYPAVTPTVWLAARLEVEVGRSYRVRVTGRFRGVDHREGWCNVFVDGAAVASRRSSGRRREGVFTESGTFEARWDGPLLEVNVASTWGKSVVFELGGVEVKAIGRRKS